MFVPRYDEQRARKAAAAAQSYAGALRLLGMNPYGGNHRLFRHWVDDVWEIPTDHFDPLLAQRRGLAREAIPLEQVLVEHSTYPRAKLKARLFETGLKGRRCELCGQGEMWRGKRMALIIDHINGVPDDNRLENLRIACPNCAATFDTHCGRKNRLETVARACAVCGTEFMPRSATQRHCSRRCGTRHSNRDRNPRPLARKVERPPYEVLVEETRRLGFSAVGRKYGVSDNAVRKWMRWHEVHGERFNGFEDAA
jgi:hypothetical protein